MVRLLPVEQLKDLVTILKRYQPRSLPILFRVQKTVEGVASYDVYVDTWPDVNLVMTRRRKPEESKDANVFTQLFALKTDNRILESILADNTFFDFTKDQWIAGVNEEYKPTVEKFESQKGLQRKDSVNYILFAATEDTLPKTSLEGDVTHGPIEKLCHVDEIAKEWNRDITREHIDFCLERFPSLCITSSKTGELIAYGFIQDYGAVGKLYVKPEFRGKGYARWIITKLARGQIEDTGFDYHISFVLDTNTESRIVHQRCGYKEYSDNRYFWVMYKPLTLQ